MCREASALVAGAEVDALAGGSPQGQCDLLRGLLCEFVCYVSYSVVGICHQEWLCARSTQSQDKSQKGERNEDHSRQLMSEDSGLQKERT